MVTVDLRLGDCLEVMPTLEAHSVDAIIADLPYGTTACKWDTVIPFAPLWAEYKRLIKPRGAIVLFGSQPFTSALVMSNAEWFRYAWVWRKSRPSGSQFVNVQPLREHEEIAVFSMNSHTYNPQKTPTRHVTEKERTVDKGGVTGNAMMKRKFDNGGFAFPRSVIEIPNPNHGSQHPTQKPVALLEYLVRTYTNEGETVLDNVMGSGTCGVACVNTGRSFIGIEKDAGYFAIAERRIAHAQLQLPLVTA